MPLSILNIRFFLIYKLILRPALRKKPSVYKIPVFENFADLSSISGARIFLKKLLAGIAIRLITVSVNVYAITILAFTTAGTLLAVTAAFGLT